MNLVAGETLTRPSIIRIGRLRHHRLLRAGLWSMADQALISATNFVTMVLLARSLTPSAFGAFTLAYTALLFANGLQAALILHPHSVIGATRTGQDYVSYTTATAGTQLALALTCGFLTVVAAIVLGAFNFGASRLLLTLAPAIVVWQFQEFVRRVLYTKQNVIGALLNDGVSYGGQLVGIAALWRMGRLTEVSAIVVLAITSAVATATGLWQIRDHLTTDVARVAWRTFIAENWRMGKWLTGSTLVSWFSGHLYPVLTAGFVSVAATGALRASQTLLGPTHILLRAVESIATPRAATEFRRAGKPALWLLLRRIMAVTAPAMALYCFAISIFAQPILAHLYGEQYSRYWWLLIIFAATYFLTFLYTSVSVALKAMEVTSPVFRAYVVSTVIVLTVGLAAVALFGLVGAATGILCHSLILNVVLWRYFFSADSES